MTVAPDRLAMLDQIHLDEGSHTDFNAGHCAMEVVSWLADEGFTDAPTCASPVLRRYVIRLNDRWDDEKRQALKPYLVRMVGTGSDGLDGVRERIAARHVAGLLAPWLRLAGLDAEADRLEASTDVSEVQDALWAARDAAWALRRAKVDEIKVKVRERLAEQGKPAVAAAVADAAADAVAVAAAVADAAAVAVAVAAAVADAAADAVAVAAAVADAAADAVAAAAADAAADADADAAADADADGTNTWSAAYQAAREYYRTHPLPISQEAADLAAAQEGMALELLDKLIDADEG